jgi:hypothetical protein
MTANAHIEAYSLVTTDGYRCDSSDLDNMNLLAGVALDEAWPGMSVVVCFYGVCENPAWKWTARQKLWANGKWPSTIPPTTGWNQLIGSVVTPTQVFITLANPILL